MDASGVDVAAAQAGLRHRGAQAAHTARMSTEEKDAHALVPPTKPSLSPWAPLLDGVWHVQTYLSALFGFVLVEPPEVMIYGLLIYGVLLAFYHFPSYTVLAVHRMHYYLTGEQC